MATTHTQYGAFKAHYRELVRSEMLDSTPLLLTEGDSWLSTPLYYNMGDWLETRCPQAVFMRLEHSGDLAVDIFKDGSLRKIERRLKAHAFDVLLVSAGGNDFVDDFLKALFAGAQPMSVSDAVNRVIASGRYGDVLNAYRRFIDAALGARPALRIVGHTYDYPRLMGKPAKLTVQQLGLAALFKRSVGDWIARYVRHALPSMDDQRQFAAALMDQFSLLVLAPLKKDYAQQFHIVELRKQLLSDTDWNDEMHPTELAFKRLSEAVHVEIKKQLPAAKRAAFG